MNDRTEQKLRMRLEALRQASADEGRFPAGYGHGIGSTMTNYGITAGSVIGRANTYFAFLTADLREDEPTKTVRLKRRTKLPKPRIAAKSGNGHRPRAER